MAKRQILLLSSSRLHGFEFLEHAKEDIDNLLKRNNVKTVLFIPYAQKDHDSYTRLVENPFNKWGYNIESLHNKQPNEIDAIQNAEAIFVGGGNTFVLLKTLCDKNLLKSITNRVLNNGVPYIGSSAGTNVATKSIKTTNDMPVVYPPTFNALNLVPFNINPHYIETDLNTKHKGETRDQRILEFLEYNNVPVIGLREGTGLLVNGNEMILQGQFGCKIFQRDVEPKEYPAGSDLSFLLQE